MNQKYPKFPRYSEFLNEKKLNERKMNESLHLDEGFVGDAMSKARQKFTDLVQKISGTFIEFIKRIIPIKKISKGAKKGLDNVQIFDSSKGSVASQVKRYYASSSYSELDDPINYNVTISESFLDDLISGKLNENRRSSSRVISPEYPDPGKVENFSAQEIIRNVMGQWNSMKEGKYISSTFIYGAPGVGKTQMIAALADKLGISLIVLDLPNIERVDLAGLPKVWERTDIKQKPGDRTSEEDFDAGYIRPSSMFPTKQTNEKGGILFLDEMANAEPHVLRALNRFIQERGLNGYVLPENWIIVAAGNRASDTDGAMDFQQNQALASRFTFMNLVPTVEEWCAWARDNNKKRENGVRRVLTTGQKVERTYIPEELIAYIARPANHEWFYKSDGSTGAGNYPNPRNWEKVAITLELLVTEDGLDSWKEINFNDSYIQRRIAADIGNNATVKLLEYFEVFRSLTKEDIAQILKDPKKGKFLPDVKKNPLKMFGLSEYLMTEVGEVKDYYEFMVSCKNAIEYLKQYNSMEVVFSSLSNLQKKDIEKGYSSPRTSMVYLDNQVESGKLTDSQIEIARSIFIELDKFYKASTKYNKE